jgi:NAD(P)-dependent dehydrogenase (short-subunit alcohol dehydrogenase family)
MQAPSCPGSLDFGERHRVTNKQNPEEIPMRLKDRRVLVTGAASGIGRAIAEMFAREGARVALLDRDAPRLNEVAAGVGNDPVAAVADVADEGEVRQAVAGAAEALGGLDGVVNSAGIDLLRPFSEVSSAEWRHVFAVNVNGPFFVCQAALAALRRAGRGTIVNIASGAALRPLEQRTAYCAAKAALVMFGKALAVDLAEDNIRVNSICPGIIDTPLFRSSWDQATDPEAERRRILERYVIKRVGRPDEIAAAALYLTSDESSYTTGTTLAVDGGRTFH